MIERRNDAVGCLLRRQKIQEIRGVQHVLERIFSQKCEIEKNKIEHLSKNIIYF